MKKRINLFIIMFFLSFLLTGCVSVKTKDEDSNKQEEKYIDCLVKNFDGKIETAKFLEKEGCPDLYLDCNRRITCQRGGIFPAQKYNIETKECENISYKKGAPCFNGSNNTPVTPNKKKKNTNTNNSNSNNKPIVEKPIKVTCNKKITCKDGSTFPAEEYNPLSQKCEPLIFAGGTPCFNEDLIQ